MGGNIWDSSSRLDAKAYHELCKRFEVGYFVIPSYYTKESFGDLDIVHSKPRDVYNHYMSANFNFIDSSKNAKIFIHFLQALYGGREWIMKSDGQGKSIKFIIFRP